MKPQPLLRTSWRKRRGTTLIVALGVLFVVTIASVSYIDRATMAVREARAGLRSVQALSVAEAGAEDVHLNLWRPFKQTQDFIDLDTALTGASPNTPRAARSGEVPGGGRYATAVIGYIRPNNDAFRRRITVRSVGFIDQNFNGTADAGEPRRTIDVMTEFTLQRSRVFDYTYFINNYGWMSGFSPSNLIVNGDMRSNGNFDFISGSGTVNGSVVASINEKLIPGSEGTINHAPTKWTDATYASTFNNTGTAFRSRMRQPYNPAIHGAVGSEEFNKWRDLVFFSQGQVVDRRIFGAALEDSSGARSWHRSGSTVTTSQLDNQPTKEVIMPDLRNFGSVSDAPNINGNRFARSKAFRNEKATFLDGTPNPNFSGNPGSANEFNSNDTPNVNYSGAYVDVWDSTLNGGAGAYRRVSSNGVVSSSVLLIGTPTRPIRIHGPVAIDGDVAIAGEVQGQGTLYARRNIHIIGSVRYANPPDFVGSNMEEIEERNEKRDFLGLAASQSIIMGDTRNFTSTTLQYMTPPFTKPRLDENGNTVPAYNGTQIDSWGIQRYRSLLEGNATYRSVAAGGVNQIDAILYTNFVGGGNVGTAGGGMTLNGTIISRDEAIVAWSLPIRMNYDNRIREREVTRQPLIDLDLPRSPAMIPQGWQDRGLSFGN